MYTGHFFENKKTGICYSYDLMSGNYYSGNMENNEFHGIGSYEWKDKGEERKYEGGW